MVSTSPIFDVDWAELGFVFMLAKPARDDKKRGLHTADIRYRENMYLAKNSPTRLSPSSQFSN